ncbi:MAG: hypothetical protein Q8N88_06285 [Nanoarchaeota archaeon]|nr:hypothetical protein [Nanoarchaeota archaeon]
MTIFFKKNIIIVLCLILFIIPFFWFSYRELDLGGDSTRLYFYDPISWLKNIALYSVNALSGIGISNPNFMMIPFLLFLSFLRSILLNNSYFLSCFFSGFLLSGGFLFTYLSTNELLKNNNKNDNLIKCSSIVAGLFFAFSPIIIYEWEKAAYYFNHILLYPLMFFLFLKYINTEKYKYIIISLFITFIFSVNFSFAVSPWFFSFFPFIFLFLFSYSIICKKLMIFLKGLILFIVFFLLIQFFQFLPQINNILDSSSPNSTAIFSNEGMKDRGLGYFLSIQPYVRLIYNITNQPQYDISKAFNHPVKDIIFNYGIKYQFLFFVYIFIVVLGSLVIRKIGLKKERMIYMALMGIFLILIFFMTANINSFLLQFYKNLFSVPGFAMFRSFYTKFNLVFIFFYALLIGMSLYYLLNIIKNKIMWFIFLGFVSFLIMFNAWPLISGRIVNGFLWQSKNVKTATKISDNYATFIDSVKHNKSDGKFLSFPLTDESYQVLQGQEGGAYFGPSLISVLAGKSDFPGLGSFSVGGNKIIKEQILGYLNNKDYEGLNYLFSLLNIKYIFHNSDDYIYNNFPNYPYSVYLKSLFKMQNDYKNFISELGYSKFYQLEHFSLYSNDKYFLPKVFSAKNIFVFDNFKNINYKILSINFPSLQNIILDRNNISEFVSNEFSKNIINVFKPKIDSDKLTLYFENNNLGEKFKLISIESLSNSNDVIIDSVNKNSYMVYLDIVSSSNIIKNYSFENEGLWSYNSKCGEPNTDAEIKYSNDAVEGQRSLLMITKKGIACSSYYLTEIDGDYAYKFSFDYKKVKGLNPRIVLFVNDKISINDLLDTNNEWHHFEKIVRLSEKSNKINIFVYTESRGGIITENLFDNFVFTKTVFMPDSLYFIDSGSEKIETPILEFKKINPTKYRIIAHRASSDFPLIFSESFNKEWKVYITESLIETLKFKVKGNDLDGYKILDDNIDGQASSDEIKNFINKGWIVSLGDGKEKEIKHQNYENGRERLNYIEKYKIDFISKNFQGTIQNDNLLNGHIWDTWFKKSLPEENHLTANGYANSWLIDLDNIKKTGNYTQNPDGSIDFELVIEFWPQRLFYLGLGISGTTLLLCLGYLVYNWGIRKKKLKQ